MAAGGEGRPDFASPSFAPPSLPRAGLPPKSSLLSGEGDVVNNDATDVADSTESGVEEVGEAVGTLGVEGDGATAVEARRLLGGV